MPFDAGGGDVLLGALDAQICHRACGALVDHCVLGDQAPPPAPPVPWKNAACCPSMPPAALSACDGDCACYWPPYLPPACEYRGVCKFGQWQTAPCVPSDPADAGSDGALDADGGEAAFDAALDSAEVAAPRTYWLTCSQPYCL